MQVNWSEIARELGEERTTDSGATMMSSSLRLGSRVAEALLGDDLLQDAVEVAARYAPGMGAAESLLTLLRSHRAADYCYERFRSETDPERRRGYADVLRNAAGESGLPWVEEFWADADESVQVLGAKMLEGLVNQRLVEPDEAEPILRAGEQHENPSVREFTGFARVAFERVFRE